MKPLHLFLLLSLILSLSLCNTSCTKEDPPSACCDCLKEASQSGKGTMSMKINGKPWSNCNPPNPDYGTVGVYWDPEHTTFRITGNKFYTSVEMKENFNIEVLHPFEGEYTGHKSTFLFSVFFIGSIPYGSSEFATDTSKPFHLFITKFDKNNRIVSGIFDCTMVKLWGDNFAPDSIIISEGRFDTKF